MEPIDAINSVDPSGGGAVNRPNHSTPDRFTVIASTNDTGTAERSIIDVNKIQQGARDKIEHIAQAIEEYAKSTQTNLQIQVNSDIDRVVVKVISTDDGRTIREIPSKEMLSLAANMEKMMGVLFNKEV